jgi:hypothetical protein
MTSDHARDAYFAETARRSARPEEDAVAYALAGTGQPALLAGFFLALGTALGSEVWQDEAETKQLRRR